MLLRIFCWVMAEARFLEIEYRFGTSVTLLYRFGVISAYWLETLRWCPEGLLLICPPPTVANSRSVVLVYISVLGSSMTNLSVVLVFLERE